MALAVVAVLVSGAVMFAAASRLRTREQAIADAAAPPRPVLTEPVESRPLVVQQIFRGEVVAGSERSVAATALEGRDSVVTGTPVGVGDEVEPGRPVIELAGRPVIVLVGEVPAYRDLRPGDVGRDVAQLEAALASLGYRVGREDGAYDSVVAAAVAELWSSLGYEPITDGPGAGAILRKAEVAFVPRLPARVLELGGSAGTLITEGPLVRLASGPLNVSATLAATEIVDLDVGDAVTMRSERSGSEFEGKIGMIGAARLDPETSQRVVDITLVPTEAPLADELGAAWVISLTVAATDQPVLVVPSAAIYTAQSGDREVVVRRDDGTEDRVRVEPGLSDGGFVEVSPSPADALRPGDEVVVGR